MTDIGGGIFSLIVTAIFLRFWKPRNEWHFTKAKAPAPTPLPASDDPHAAEAAALLGSRPPPAAAEPPLTFRNVAFAWAPFALMSVLLLLTGLVRQKEERRDGSAWSIWGGVLRQEEGAKKPVMLGPLQTNYHIPVRSLHKEVMRDAKLHDPSLGEQQPEGALFNFAWLTAPGTAVFVAALLSMLMLRMNFKQVAWVFKRTFVQMKIPIPTIAFMLGLSYVTRYAGMDATLGIAFAGTGLLYPFFAPLLGWLGVFLTGTDAGSNALFGSLQKITATAIHNTGVFGHLDLSQAQVLICTSNSTGGVMGKMIDAQSIVVATAATNQLGREADIFKAVVWHSILLAATVGVITLVQAYLPPFTLLVPAVKP
jgi:lactate permease